MSAPALVLTALHPDPARAVIRPRRTRAGSRQNGQPQLWQHESADGHWLYFRVEDAGTSWRIYRLVNGVPDLDRWVPALSLDHARALTAGGTAADQLAEQASAAARPRCTWRSQSTASVCTRPDVGDGRCDDPRHALAVAS